MLIYSGWVMVKGVFRQQNTSSEPLLDPILFVHDTRTYQDGDNTRYSDRKSSGAEVREIGLMNG